MFSKLVLLVVGSACLLANIMQFNNSNDVIVNITAAISAHTVNIGNYINNTYIHNVYLFYNDDGNDNFIINGSIVAICILLCIVLCIAIYCNSINTNIRIVDADFSSTYSRYIQFIHAINTSISAPPQNAFVHYQWTLEQKLDDLKIGECIHSDLLHSNGARFNFVLQKGAKDDNRDSTQTSIRVHSTEYNVSLYWFAPNQCVHGLICGSFDNICLPKKNLAVGDEQLKFGSHQFIKVSAKPNCPSITPKIYPYVTNIFVSVIKKMDQNAINKAPAVYIPGSCPQYSSLNRRT